MATNDNYVSKVEFADIVDDCLWYTLGHLSFTEKFGVMRVCQRWREVTTELIENAECIELKMVPNEISLITLNDRPDYSDENVKRDLEAFIGKQAELFFNYKLEHVENVSIRGFRPTPFSKYQSLTLMDIGWLFRRLPHLKSLSMTETTMLDFYAKSFRIGTPLSVLSTRLKSLHLNSFEHGLWLFSFFERENVLEELCLKGDYYSCKKPAKLILLKRTRLFVGSSLEDFSNLIENSHDLIDLRVRLCFPMSHKTKFNVLLYLTRFTHLKTLELCFAQRKKHRLDDSVPLENSTLNLCGDIETPHFPNLQRFQLSGVLFGHSRFEKILSKMPSIKSLQLSNVFVRCTCKKKICRDCPKIFIEKIASLEHLNELHLNYRTDTPYNFRLIHVLERLLDDEKLPRLRKLRCTLTDLFSPSLFKAFANMAWETPKESFVMFAPFDDQPNKEKLLTLKPRNLQAIHCCCTTRTDYS